MELPNTESMSKARQHYDNIVAEMDLTRTYSMQELNTVIARYCTEHDLSELEHANILEVKWDRMIADTHTVPSHGESH